MVERRSMDSKGLSKRGGTICSTPEDLVVSLLEQIGKMGLGIAE